MSLASDYAQALYALGDRAKLGDLRGALARRGHEKLLPHIYSEYQKLVLQEHRLKEHKKVTPEKERTRVLLELYRTLTNA
ncbi:hypothetical protein EXS62_01320 [Candidatus Kaiserbacteria bacterium]|nr:hypothetical protein [Candidatus Kaiserbacteria bacterium]